MTESRKRMQKLNFIKMVWPQINLFHSLATPAAGHKRAKEFYGRSFRGYCARMVGVTMIIKACFYTTFYARKKVENTFLPKSNGLATKRRQNRFTFV